MSNSSSTSPNPAPYHRLKRAPITPPRERPSWYPPNDERNSEANHLFALEEARLHHERVRKNALTALRMHEAQEELAALGIREAQIAACEEANAEAERKRRELNERAAAAEAETRAQVEAKAQAEAQAQALAQARQAQQAQQAPSPVQAAQPPPVPTPIVSQPLGSTTNQQHSPYAQPSVNSQPTSQAPPPPTQPSFAPQPNQAPPTTQSTSAQQFTQAPVQAQAQTTQATTSQPVFAADPSSRPSDPPAFNYKQKENTAVINQDVVRLENIHQALKKLREGCKDQFDKNPNLKKKAGEMRRLIRMSVGQLTGGDGGQQGQNKHQVDTIINTLQDALDNRVVPNEMVNPGWFVVDGEREPMEGGALNNGNVPMLFIFLLNHFSKAIINQLAEEAGIKPLMAGSIGILAVKIFSRPSFLWRGKSLIDILIAKYRMVCPVLFGVRGDEGKGKAQLGWKQVNGKFIHEEVHVNRMTGFGAGFAAICLRDFSRTKLSHPYSVSYYWMAMASIMSTPAENITKTQCFVLKAMIDNFEMRFLQFYGAAALAALQIATIHFPARVGTQNDATRALEGLPAKLKLQLGIDLEDDSFRG